MSFTVGPNTGGTYPAALTNNATFYTYEPFSFTLTGTAALTVSGTLVSYCTGSTTTSVVFSSTTGFLTTGSSGGETLTITPTGGTVVTYTLFINAARFIITPAVQGIMLYQNEPISTTLSILGFSSTSVAFQAQTLLCNIYTVPTLPSSTLTLTGPVNAVSTSTFTLGGIPGILSASSNYYVVGSNSSNGYVATTLFAIQVSKERMWIKSSAAMTNSGSAFTVTSPILLTIGTSLTSPPTFTVLTPVSVTSTTFTSNNFPPGISFTNGALVGTPTTTAVTSYVSTITASAFGLSSLSATITLTFNYAPIIKFTPPTLNVYSNVASSNQLSASVFPSNAIVTFSSTSVPAGFALTSNGLLTGTTSVSTPTFPVTVASAGLTSVTSNVSITALPVPITITASPSSLSGYYLGQTPPTMTLTFSSGAYTTKNWIAVNGVTITGLPAGFVSVWNYPRLTATIVGTPIVAGTGVVSVTVNSIDGGSGSVTIPYSFLADSCPITTTTTSPFAFSQNVAITPIQFSGTPVSGLPISYYYGTSAIPLGLVVSPGGLLYGTPTTPTTTPQTFTGVYGTTGGNYSTFPVSSVYTYTIASDTVQLASSPLTTTVTPGSPVSIALTAQTSSGVTPTGTIVTSTYPYGLVVTPSSILGTLGLCVYPGIVLPSSAAVYGTFNPNSIPAVIALSNANPQIINRFILGAGSSSGYSVYCDNGTMSNFTSIYTNTSTPLPGPHSFQIISNTTSSLPSWSGTLMIADGTAGAITSSKLTSSDFFTSVSGLTGGATIMYCIYYSWLSFSSWIAFTSDNRLLFSSSPGSAWVSRSGGGSSKSPNKSTDAGDAVSGYVLQGFNGYLLLGGAANGGNNALVYSTMTGIPTYFVFNNTSSTFTTVYSISASSTRAVAGGTLVSGVGLQYSTDGITWSSVTTSGTATLTTVTDVVYGGPGVDTWMALGPSGVAWSADGKAWTYIPFTGLGTQLGPLQFDGTYWCFFSTSGGVFTLYYHDALSSTMSTISTWKIMTVSVPGASALYTFPTPIYTLVGSPQVTVYTGTTPSGPVFTSIPTTYSIYQYLPISPIVFSASQSPSYFLGSTLPPGMSWNGTTISGLSVKLGTFTVTVYAQSTSGSTAQTVTFIVQRAPITPRITSPAGYTSFLREKVTADAATSSINNHATPFEVGPFLLERPPVVTTAPEICCEVTQTVKRIIN